MTMLKMCLNPKVIAGLGVVALGILVVNPNLFLSALPLLLFAACPLSMLLMGKMMMGQGSSGATEGVYACPMHPEVRSDQPGRCTKCGMALVGKPKESATEAPTSNGNRLHELQAKLQNMSTEQVALAKEIRELQAKDADSTNEAVAEAERITKASKH